MSEIAMEPGLNRKKYKKIIEKYLEAFGQCPPTYDDPVRKILSAGTHYGITNKGIDRFEKEVDRRIKDNDPFEIPEGYWDMMW